MYEFLFYFDAYEDYKDHKEKNNCNAPKRSWSEADLLACLCAHPSLICSMRWNPIIYLHKVFAHIRRSMMSWRRPLFGPHSLSMNPSETRAAAGGLKNQLRSPPSAATIGAAARRLGKVWQLKSIQGSVKHRPCVPLPPTPMGRWGQRRPWKGKEYVWVAN